MDCDSKIKMLLDMQEHPEEFSEEALEQMLGDAEAQKLLEGTAQLKRAMTNDAFTMSGREVEDEWQHFASTCFAAQKPQRSWLKIAAMFAGILFVAGFAYAAIHMMRQSRLRELPMAQQKEYEALPPVSPALQADTIVRAEPVVFDNVSLDSIAKVIAAYHHVATDMQNGQAKELRFYFVWKKEDGLQEVVEKLNMFELVNMTVENGKLVIR